MDNGANNSRDIILVNGFQSIDECGACLGVGMGEIRENTENGDQKSSIGREEIGKYFEGLFSVVGCCAENFGDVGDGFMGMELSEVEKGSGESRVSGTEVEGKFVKGFRCNRGRELGFFKKIDSFGGAHDSEGHSGEKLKRLG